MRRTYQKRRTAPGPIGLYDPRYEHDACGIGLIARLNGEANHEVISKALTAVENMEHRGAYGADPKTGDGAGILMQIPDEFFRAVSDFPLPPRGDYGVLVCFLPTQDTRREELEGMLEEIVCAEGQKVLGWRDVPIHPEHTGAVAAACRPAIRQLFVGAGPAHVGDLDAFERKLYVIRRVYERTADDPELYVVSSSAKTVNYKGMMISYQLAQFYPDLTDERTKSALAIFHSRFSTNTFPSWALAHPYRVVCHNGEINTLRGNINWMHARESELVSELFGDDLEKILPAIGPGNSDSAVFDNVIELLMLAGRSLPHAAMMMVPEAYSTRNDLPRELQGFYAFHACLMEPWDGPAATIFTDGTVVGATLDRNGLRPGRWLETTDGYVLLGSETGLLNTPPEEIKQLGRLKPGKLFLVDLAQGRIISDEEAKHDVASRHPYGEWHRRNAVRFANLPQSEQITLSDEPLVTRQRVFGYSEEDLRVLLTPMARDGTEPTGSMGNDITLAALSEQAPSLFSYFKQLFAQVTNPPIDPIRENIVMSLGTSLGRERNLFHESPKHAHKLLLNQPILLNRDLETVRNIVHRRFAARTINTTWSLNEGAAGLRNALRRICAESERAIEEHVNIIILSDRRIGPRRVPIPSLLATAAVHSHLVRRRIRLRAGIIVESGEPREVHHFATLIGYGASAINPYVALETLDLLVAQGKVKGTYSEANGEAVPISSEIAAQNYIKAIDKGLLKTISKMGISTIESYRSAQIFEAVGLSSELVEEFFPGTVSRIGGVTLSDLATEALLRHQRAYPAPPNSLLPLGGVYAWRRDAEHHIWNPDTIALLQHALGEVDGDLSEEKMMSALHGDAAADTTVRSSSAYAKYCEYADAVNEDAARRATLRGLLGLRPAGSPLPLSEVESATKIVKRFNTGAMSLGSISREAHETLAIAMNRIGGRSNTGEGGEDPERYRASSNGDNRRSAIKQVASGRFGVTIEYLVNADELQIKIAQGAKPGEGGQLPGHKVSAYIGRIRSTMPGVGLISPPPHHDIYSIEDLKQLIYDLRCANPQAEVSVKLVASAGVGTIATGVSKANADRVLISGHDGGTGASPLTSIQHGGIPWEIGLAETQQTLLLNDLRSRIIVQTDGQLKTGRDVVVAALLGADEMGFSTAPLIGMGCIMMRACHLNTCPVGIATQDEGLRQRFRGTPEHVINYFFFVAEEVREILASLGLHSLDEAIGRVDLLFARAGVKESWKAHRIDLSQVLTKIAVPEGTPLRRVESPPPVLNDALDWEIIEQAKPALDSGQHVRIALPIRNRNRSVGGILSHEVTKAYGGAGLPENTIEVEFEGSSGQSFGAWLAPGITFTLRGDTQDYVGKGLSGGILVVRPREGMNPAFCAEENVIIGNTVLYGATSGRAFFRGLAGERFAVRNSGVSCVVEGVGDHACEYMTGGRVVILGPTGRNFAAGMSGGIAYILDEDKDFPEHCNLEMVGLERLTAADAEEVHALVAEHQRLTDSPVSARVLANWQQLLDDDAFMKVMPHDYKRVLAEQSEALQPAAV